MSEQAIGETQVQRSAWRSIGAVFAGLVVVVLLSVGTDAVMEKAGIFPAQGQPMSDALFLVATVYRTIYGVVGGYVTARLAPGRPMQHALVLGGIGVVLGTVGAVAMWNAPAAIGHHWYPLALVALALPQSWLGGKLRTR